MRWWDDLWLNESFAEWMGNKASDMWDPKSQGQEAMLAGTQGAMGKDGLVSARENRQPIASTDDNENAFDDNTYQKRGSDIGMFERWLGPDVFQKGVRLHLSQHAFGSATADDFLSALSSAAQRDVKTPFHTFLDQPGVPFIEAALKCDAGATPTLHLTQSCAFLPGRLEGGREPHVASAGLRSLRSGRCEPRVVHAVDEQRGGPAARRREELPRVGVPQRERLGLFPLHARAERPGGAPKSGHLEAQRA